MENKYYWQDYCNQKQIKYEKVKSKVHSPSEPYYFTINWKVIIIQTIYPIYANLVNEEEVLKQINFYLYEYGKEWDS